MSDLPVPEPAAPAGADPALAGVNAAAGIGERLKAYRNMRGLKVSELARMVNVSPSLISQIERSQSRPSVATLFSLARALDVSVDDFFTDEFPTPTAEIDGSPAGRREPAGFAGGVPAAHDLRHWPVESRNDHRYMIHKSERAAIDIEGGVRWERLTPTMLEELEFLELVYEPGAQSNPVPYTHPGIDMVVLLEGELDAYIAFDQCHLTPGDSIMFPSSLPHRYVNPGRVTARGISVILMNQLWRGPAQDESARTEGADQRRDL